MKNLLLLFLLGFNLCACDFRLDMKRPAGKTVSERFPVPSGFEELSLPPKSFARYLQRYPLRADGHISRRWDGKPVPKWHTYSAVLALDIYKKRDLEQCADVIMHLIADYRKARKEHIQFSSFTTPVVYKGNYKKFLLEAFDRCNTQSLDKDLITVRGEIKPGDVLNRWGKGPLGHIVLVVRVAKDKDGNQLLQLAQGGTPAHDMELVRNRNILSRYRYWFTPDRLPKGYTRADFFRFKRFSTSAQLARK